MARKRMIDPSFWTDEQLGTCPIEARLLFMGLISQADDEGRLSGHPALIKSQIYPYDFEMEASTVDEWIEMLQDKRLIIKYTINNQKYIVIRNFKKHQTINKPVKSKLPEPPNSDYRSPTVVLPYNELTTTSQEKVIEEKLKEEKLSKEKDITTAGDEFKIVLNAFCEIHGKAEHQVFSQITDIQKMIDKGIPSSTIISVMKEKHAEKARRNESVNSFSYYHKAIVEAWEGGKKVEEYGGSIKGLRSGSNQTASPRSEGESKIYKGKWDDTVIQMPKMSG
jgi:hypothetical protein